MDQAVTRRLLTGAPRVQSQARPCESAGGQIVLKLLPEWVKMSMWIYCLMEKRTKSSWLHSQHTTHQPWRHALVLRRRTGDFLHDNTHVILRGHASTGLKPSFIAKLTECGVDFTCMHPQKGPIHKILSCATIRAAQFVNHMCLIWMEMRQFCCIPYSWHRQAHLLGESNQRFSWRCFQSSTNSDQFFLSTCLMRVLLLSWNISPAAFSLICKLCKYLCETGASGNMFLNSHLL